MNIQIKNLDMQIILLLNKRKNLSLLEEEMTQEEKKQYMEELIKYESFSNLVETIYPSILEF